MAQWVNAPGTESRSNPKTEPGPKLENEPEIEPGTEPGTKSGTEPEMKPETQSHGLSLVSRTHHLERDN